MNFHINEVGEKCFVGSLLSPTASNQRVHVIFSYVLVAKGCPLGYTHLWSSRDELYRRIPQMMESKFCRQF